MANNEVKLVIDFELTKDSNIHAFPGSGAPQTIAVSGDNAIQGRQTMPTTPSTEAVVLGEVAYGGVWIFANRSSTTGENINLRDGSGGTNFLTLKPGEVFPVRLASDITALHAVADAGTPLLEYWGLDD